jgi:hypothetical protein
MRGPELTLSSEAADKFVIVDEQRAVAMFRETAPAPRETFKKAKRKLPSSRLPSVSEIFHVGSSSDGRCRHAAVASPAP